MLLSAQANERRRLSKAVTGSMCLHGVVLASLGLWSTAPGLPDGLSAAEAADGGALEVTLVIESVAAAEASPAPIPEPEVETPAPAEPEPVEMAAPPAVEPAPVAPVAPPSRKPAPAKSEPKPEPAEPAPPLETPAVHKPRTPPAAPIDTAHAFASKAQADKVAATPASASAGITSERALWRDAPLILDARFAAAPRAPVYPSASIERNEEGEVVLRVLIAATGETREIIIYRSSGFARLDRAAEAAARRWAFAPAVLAAGPRDAWVQVPVKFRLN